PVELGSAMGRIGSKPLDDFLLPRLLDDEERALNELIRGYVWSRYIATSIAWVKGLDLDSWSPAQKGIFFSDLPFVAEVWNLAEERLGPNLSEYWKRIWPNPFQAQDDILEAAQKALANKRPEIAIDCLAALRHKNRDFPSDLA